MKVEVKTTSYRNTRTLMYSVSMHEYISHNIKYFLLHIQYINTVIDDFKIHNLKIFM